MKLIKKQIQIGEYLLTIEQIHARFWLTISIGKLNLVRRNERSEKKAMDKGVEKIQTLINL